MGALPPLQIRYVPAYDAKLCAAVPRNFVRTLLGFLSERAEAARVPAGRSGAVVLAQEL